MERQPEVEILVHIRAPSRAADDVTYRSLAASYVNFEPMNHVDFTPHLHSSISNSSDGRYRLGHLGAQQTPAQDNATSSQLSGLLGALKSPQASFRSVIDNAASPRIRTGYPPGEVPGQIADRSSMPATPSPWESPSSVVQDSYIENAVQIPSLTSPTRVLEYFLQQRYESLSPSPNHSSQRSGNITFRGGPSQPSTYPSLGNRLAPSLASDTPSIVPCTPLPSSLSPSDGRFGNMSTIERSVTATRKLAQIPQTQHEVSSDNIVEETIIAETSSDPTSVTRADSEPPPTKLCQPGTASAGPQALLRTASDIGPRASLDQKPTITVSFLRDHGYTYDSLELHAPDPPVSIEQVDPVSFITPGLEKLAKDLDISKRFKPREEKRDLRPTERGYWLVDCSAWDEELKRKAWAYLANYIGTGVAGWGIWCRRDLDFQWFRVYCWGTVATHIYFLLYLASFRQILYTRSSWVDGEGVAVITMEVRK
ncbi:hypothetical protein GGR54DRAFT_586313 [Hypoxylon sp. NC1633]|nr:hypothetical protein GGR54DRAFT_586313 [Hypoxylon sp. NC1633]